MSESVSNEKPLWKKRYFNKLLEYFSLHRNDLTEFQPSPTFGRSKHQNREKCNICTCAVRFPLNFVSLQHFFIRFVSRNAVSHTPRCIHTHICKYHSCCSCFSSHHHNRVSVTVGNFHIVPNLMLIIAQTFNRNQKIDKIFRYLVFCCLFRSNVKLCLIGPVKDVIN